LIFILGIDALDYELVEKLNLNNLKQLEYSKIVVPINKELGHPLSPEVWASFLIGEHKVMEFVFSHPYANVMKNIRNVIRKMGKMLVFFHIDSDNRFRRKINSLINSIFAKLGLTSPGQFGKIQKTFLDITKSYEINVPFYNFDNKTFYISYLFGKGELSLEQTVMGIKLIYESRKKQIFNELDHIGDEHVVFAFMHTADMLQHCSYLRFSEI